tara:strand:+ start:668 stop:871 length:204 start_codon:yes stop_codon:yes gene_type:complete
MRKSLLDLPPKGLNVLIKGKFHLHQQITSSKRCKMNFLKLTSFWVNLSKKGRKLIRLRKGLRLKYRI